MNEIQIFESERFGKVRTIEMNGEPWFVGKDIAEALGYEKSRNAIEAHVAEEDKTTALIQGTGSNYKSNAVLINESGLYSLIFGSKLDSAKEFKHWVTHDVLPSIRKTGSFTVKEVPQDSPLEKAKFLHEMAKDYADLPGYRQILDAYAVKEVTGTFALPLPEVKKNERNAGQVGEVLGISGQMVGKLANKYGLKTEEFGVWRMDKAKFSSKEVPNFFYFDNAIDKFRECIELEAQEKAKVKEAS